MQIEVAREYLTTYFSCSLFPYSVLFSAMCLFTSVRIGVESSCFGPSEATPHFGF